MYKRLNVIFGSVLLYLAVLRGVSNMTTFSFALQVFPREETNLVQDRRWLFMRW